MKNKTLLILSLALLNAFVFYYTLAWTEPSQSPPGSNVPELINVSSTAQTKEGELTVANLYLNANSSGEGSIINADYIQGYNDLHLVSNDNSGSHDTAIYLGTSSFGKKIAFYIDDVEKMTLDSNGRLGIATNSPSYKLDVAGSINGTQLCIAGDCKSSWPSGGIQGSISKGQIAFGTNTDAIGGDSNLTWDSGQDVLNVNGEIKCNKLTTDEIDPVYDIEGTKYATYGHSTIGIKEEVVGKRELLPWDNSLYAFVIDFNTERGGSDLWLFRKITDFGKDWKDLVVSLTPEGQAQVWYKLLPEKNQIVIFGDKSVKVSFRLIAPRFDWPERNTNLAPDQKTHGIIIKE